MSRKKHSWSTWVVFWLSSWGNLSNFAELRITEDGETRITEDGEQRITEGKV